MYNGVYEPRCLASSSAINVFKLDKKFETNTEVCKHFEKHKKIIVESKDSNKKIRNLLIDDKVMIKKRILTYLQD
ncbi:hypothetical protein CWI37_1853p0020 [Hamiltosporidium tvaerminnensis]|uniref:Uncharacterized protein n=1 Tax=Hamiltosporidium tvaerminnensis TaxID=1176355 RepID=A0A4Q9KTY5_9MICR|nr:hypothetical protein CWI37_1853p0020 [Hamiltosporidium tvaerminnensis]